MIHFAVLLIFACNCALPWALMVYIARRVKRQPRYERRRPEAITRQTLGVPAGWDVL